MLARCPLDIDPNTAYLRQRFLQVAEYLKSDVTLSIDTAGFSCLTVEVRPHTFEPWNRDFDDEDLEPEHVVVGPGNRFPVRDCFPPDFEQYTF